MDRGKALLIIDMQKGSFQPKSIRYKADGIIDNINELLSMFRSLNLPVVYIQHDGTGSGEFVKYNTDWEILDELNLKDDDNCVDKYANDVFYNSKLSDLLDKLNVKDIWVTGCATEFCVESTIQSALSKDYNVNVVEDGHTTADKPHLQASEIINHYNWVWRNMLPTKGKVDVISTKQVKNMFSEIECDKNG